MSFRFERLEIWRLAVEFAGVVYDATDKFPKEEIFGLSSQLKRAATSVYLNIAEGTGRSSRRDFAHFLDIATGSVFEVVTAVAIAKNKGWLGENQYADIYSNAEALAKKIATFKSSVVRETNS